jgi:NhaP-type Na+/H+ or K+/H+ antiporter
MILVGELGSEVNRQVLSVIVLTVLLSVFIHGLSAVPLSNAYGHYAARSRKPDGPAAKTD